MSDGLKVRLAAGECVIGSWLNSCSPVVGELMAGCGFDFLTVDAEHSAVDVAEAQQMFQAIRSATPSCAALVRVPGADYASIKRYVDAGADGVICPLVNTAEQAAEVVRAVKYPPLGQRGVGFCRDNCYGMDLEQRVTVANDKTLVCVQIEHIDAMQDIDAILQVEGVDAAFIGPYDLSASMGITAQFDHPEYLAARQAILDACNRHSVVAGIHVVQPEVDAVRQAHSKGYRLIAFSLDITILTSVCTSALKQLGDLRTS